MDEAVCVAIHSDETVALLLIEGLDRAHLVCQLPASLLHDLLHNPSDHGYIDTALLTRARLRPAEQPRMLRQGVQELCC